MDSMRSLNTSLPSASRPNPPPQPDLHQAFRSAALSVTNLYKTAAADQTRAHGEGYREALEDLLAFLDSKNLGLGDGEGWKVRQWATERLDGEPTTMQSTSDSDEESAEEKRARSSSPVMERKQSPEIQSSSPSYSPEQDARPESAPPIPPQTTTPQTVTDITPPRSEFTFTTQHAYPANVESEMEVSPPTSIPQMRVELHPRRQSSRHHSTRHNTRSNNTNLGNGAGFKRRLPFNEYFDLSGPWNGKDGLGGSKRGRFS
ncbi:uncharacterized protein BDZ99DRAFT_265828 [Mytilinidion resinicola]|uniref:Uncharacterized protein n=1 Tax=Mytilinidion resinicola TaxID=574789 RepID=A0A6A6YWV7_9PEZI|nr:uncharacterized protein BDZ99DRAFT_265828 [Mytilinidion resinicola]KAF2812387.1 hypothetical protein BDZ99DRAFT_265828 [Mytilinidion resinicola]